MKVYLVYADYDQEEDFLVGIAATEELAMSLVAGYTDLEKGSKYYYAEWDVIE